MMKIKNGNVVILGMLLMVMLFSGCNGSVEETTDENMGGTDETVEPADGEATDGFPKTIHHAKGETVIESKPETVAILYFPYAEHLFAIDEASLVGGVVGLKSLQNFPVYEPFLASGEIIDLGDEANLEQIVELNPDVIIATEVDDKIYEQLEKITDTVMIPMSENWQETIIQVGAVVGEEEKAQQYIDSFNQKLTDIAATMEQTEQKGKTALFMMTWANGFNYYSGVRMAHYYEELGFEPFAELDDYGEIGLEGVSELDPDYIFLAEDFTETAETKLQDLEESPVWNQLTAVKHDHVYVVDTEMMGPLAMGQFKGLEVIEQIMSEAV
ncbi:ABC transporter substrate-binding protein [Halalkalibacterium halodurans]|nr:ABC transporter substrate-binding protein [Halalkalibacterium halodurans]